MRNYFYLAAAWLALCLSNVAQASPPQSLNADAYGRLPNIELMKMSPSGQRIAYISVDGSVRHLQVKDLSGKVVLSAPAGDIKIRNLDWAGNDHIILSVSMTQSFANEIGEYNHSLIINLASSKSFTVFKSSQNIFNATFGYHGSVMQNGRWYGYFGGVTLQKTLGFEPTLNSENFVDLYKVDLDSGESVIAATGHQYPHSWAIDATGKVIAHAVYDRRSGNWTLSSGKDGGANLATLSAPYGATEIMGMGRTTGTIVIDKDDPEEWSLIDGSHTHLLSTGQIDEYLFDPTHLDLVGVSMKGDKTEQTFFDAVLADKQAAFRKALGDTVQILSWSVDRQRLVLYTVGGSDSGTYWLADGRNVKAYAYAYPEIPDANVGMVKAITYTASDGQEIHAILTLPPSREAKGLPVVILPHGGPQAHDSVGFDWWAQAFAGRGYAVLQPNFRGSDGYGVAFRDAGFGQWGRKMQTDVSEGLGALADQGVVDPKRACIVGASYGGYVALAGVTVQHGLYRCAVSYGGVFDLGYLLDHEFPESSTDNAGGRYLLKFLGANSTGDASLRDVSPARLAAKADAPILLIHGIDDTVVPVGQSREMAAALRRAGKPVDLVELKGEDHWLSQDVTRKSMLSAALAFVEKNDPPN